ncbi:hypothetical protein FHR53_000058 [Xanthomonas arboricola]|uniref:hypothetical protein n=1 Tax=Xanthomonas TaxID=338 RepID=UPI000AC98EC5|nr:MULTISPECIES: hypothetical protein [Xanthomonas]MCC4607005.1 hypothetical protein [Xanthomonas campestris pv. zinniae]MBB3803074.1 hypothetical protein [Xanthomonas cannabis]MBB3803948.1 hypothetical protein [Xanthomonas cannabis]NIJ99982.1 hypothetical protein [Xanthomonas cannabis]NIK19677.1 hypothetical protein [Xanthomonas cannabis]
MCLPRPSPRTLYGAVFSLSLGLTACSPPPHNAQAVTPAEALCLFVPHPPDDELPSDRRDESMQQLALASRCGSALTRGR